MLTHNIKILNMVNITDGTKYWCGIISWYFLLRYHLIFLFKQTAHCMAAHIYIYKCGWWRAIKLQLLSAHRFIWLGIWHHNAAIETQFPDYAFDVFFILQLDSYRNVLLDYYLAMYWLWKNSCFVTLSLSWAYHELYCSVSYCVILNSCKHFPLNTSILASSVCICILWWCDEHTGTKQCCAVLTLHFLVFIYFKYSQINEQKCTFFPWLHQFSRTLCSC